ncbi:unnamed protein product [Discosporangium mesarthrocarpum]
MGFAQAFPDQSSEQEREAEEVVERPIPKGLSLEVSQHRRPSQASESVDADDTEGGFFSDDDLFYDQEDDDGDAERGCKRGWRKRVFATKPGVEIFVGGLTRSTRRDMLKDWFQHAGEITEVRIARDKRRRRCRGYGYVRFATSEEANRAINVMHRFEFKHGRFLGVLPADENRTLFVGNLKEEWKRDELCELLREKMPGLKKVEPIPDKENSSKIRTFCFLEFHTHEEASAIYNMHHQPNAASAGQGGSDGHSSATDTDPDPGPPCTSSNGNNSSDAPVTPVLMSSQPWAKSKEMPVGGGSDDRPVPGGNGGGSSSKGGWSFLRGLVGGDSATSSLWATLGPTQAALTTEDCWGKETDDRRGGGETRAGGGEETRSQVEGDGSSHPGRLQGRPSPVPLVVAGAVLKVDWADPLRYHIHLNGGIKGPSVAPTRRPSFSPDEHATALSVTPPLEHHCPGATPGAVGGVGGVGGGDPIGGVSGRGRQVGSASLCRGSPSPQQHFHRGSEPQPEEINQPGVAGVGALGHPVQGRGGLGGAQGGVWAHLGHEQQQALPAARQLWGDPGQAAMRSGRLLSSHSARGADDDQRLVVETLRDRSHTAPTKSTSYNYHNYGSQGISGTDLLLARGHAGSGSGRGGGVEVIASSLCRDACMLSSQSLPPPPAKSVTVTPEQRVYAPQPCSADLGVGGSPDFSERQKRGSGAAGFGGGRHLVQPMGMPVQGIMLQERQHQHQHQYRHRHQEEYREWMPGAGGGGGRGRDRPSIPHKSSSMTGTTLAHLLMKPTDNNRGLPPPPGLDQPSPKPGSWGPRSSPIPTPHQNGEGDGGHEGDCRTRSVGDLTDSSASKFVGGAGAGGGTGGGQRGGFGRSFSVEHHVRAATGHGLQGAACNLRLSQGWVKGEHQTMELTHGSDKALEQIVQPGGGHYHSYGLRALGAPDSPLGTSSPPLMHYERGAMGGCGRKNQQQQQQHHHHHQQQQQRGRASQLIDSGVSQRDHLPLWLGGPSGGGGGEILELGPQLQQDLINDSNSGSRAGRGRSAWCFPVGDIRSGGPRTSPSPSSGVGHGVKHHHRQHHHRLDGSGGVNVGGVAVDEGAPSVDSDFYRGRRAISEGTGELQGLPLTISSPPEALLTGNPTTPGHRGPTGAPEQQQQQRHLPVSYPTNNGKNYTRTPLGMPPPGSGGSGSSMPSRALPFPDYYSSYPSPVNPPPAGQPLDERALFWGGDGGSGGSPLGGFVVPLRGALEQHGFLALGPTPGDARLDGGPGANKGEEAQPQDHEGAGTLPGRGDETPSFFSFSDPVTVGGHFHKGQGLGRI